LPLEVVDRNKSAADFYHLKVENPTFPVFFHVSTPNEVKLGAYFGGVGKPIPVQ